MIIFKYFKKLYSVAVKIFIVLAVFFTVINLFLYFIAKDKPVQTYDPIQKNRQEIYKTINDPKLASTKEGKLTVSLYRMMMCNMIGEACTEKASDGDKNFKHSLFGKITGLITLPYANPPASGLYWAYNGLQNAGLVPKTYAAEGIGFSGLKPFMNLWKVFRDISYMLLVLVLVAIGFMIMFRMKINPQTVISIENALPKIILSLLLITFSFAIAGFLIDLMYVIIVISISIISNNGANYNAAEFQNSYLTAGTEKIWTSLFPVKGALFGGFGLNTLFGIGNSMLNILPTWFNSAIRVFAIIPTFMVGSWITGLLRGSGATEIADNLQILGTGVGKLPSGILGWIILVTIILFGFALVPQLLIAILVFFTILLIFFRILFLLFKAYLQVLLLVIFAPIFLLLEAIPGRNAFTFWFKNLFAEILTFPLVIILFLVGYVIVNTVSAPNNGAWAPPFLYGINTNAFAILLGMGLLFMIPEFVKMVKELMGVKPLPVGLGLGTFFAGAGTGAGGALGLVGQYGSLSLAMPGLRGVAKNLVSGIPPLKKLFEQPQQ